MKYLNYRDLKRRRKLYNNEIEQKRIKSIFKNRNISFSIRFLYMQKMSMFNRNSFPNRIKNRCLINNRNKSIYRDFKLNRISLRELASLGFINGLKKSSW